MRHIISFSIWGDNPLYSNGVLANLELASLIYPGWIPRVYVDDVVSVDIRNQMAMMGAEVNVVNNDRGAWYGLFWRFLPACDPDVEYFISRDTDSRLNSREYAAVGEWLASGKPFHVMRDHKNHDVPILGGMWGCRGGYLPNLIKQIAEWPDTDHKGCDQKFLAAKIWPTVKDDHIGHDGFYPNRYGGPKARPFPKHPPMKHGKHVGEVIQ